MEQGQYTPMREGIVVGLDLGDKHSYVTALDVRRSVFVDGKRVATREKDLVKSVEKYGSKLRVVIETGGQSGWVSRVLTEAGHEVIVANARKVRLIYRNRRKGDKVDAQYLARLGAFDPQLLSPVEHRSAEAQADLTLLRGRDLLVRSRTRLIAGVRGLSKNLGFRMTKCSTRSFPKQAREKMPEEIKEQLEPMLEVIAQINEKIEAYDQQIGKLAEEKYREVEYLRQVPGVGLITSMSYVLTLADPSRFAKSRSVGAYVGLVPRRDDSGESSRQLPISKEGDRYLRRMLIGSAQYILGPFGKDSELRRFGLKLASRGGKNGKKRAVVAVARKLAILLHQLWYGEVYEPFYEEEQKAAKRQEQAA